MTRTPLTKQEILSQYSGCFNGIGQFQDEPYKFHLKSNHRHARHAPRKVPLHLEDSFKQEINSLVEQGILKPVTAYTDWVNSCVFVEKGVKMNSSNSQAPDHTNKKKLRICLDPRVLNKALEREPYHTHSVDNCKSEGNDSIHHTGLQERILNGGTSSRETYMYGTTLW